MFFDSWGDLGRILVAGVLAYLGLVFLLRISGKRTLSKMNAFDLVVTVALGSTMANALLSKETSLADGLVAFAVLIFLQYIITWLSVRSSTVFKLIKAQPTLLYHQGQFLRDVMKTERVTEEEIRAAVRGQGIGPLEKVEAVVLETDGSFTVLGSAPQGETSALANVANHPPQKNNRPEWGDR